MAATADSYKVQKLYEYIPLSVAMDIKHKVAYVAKHRVANPSLLTEHLKVKYIIMRFATAILNQEDYNDHCTILHGVDINTLSREDVVVVDPKSVFRLCHTPDIEKLGESEHDAILNNWYNTCIACAVVTKSSNRSNSDMALN